jgi:hypothetical protein
MQKLPALCSFFSYVFSQKRISIYSKYNKISKNFFLFLVNQGFLLRLIVCNKTYLQLFFKYNNGLPVFSTIHFFVSKNQKIFLGCSQIADLVIKYPNLFFVFYCSGTFHTQFTLKNDKKGGLLIAVIK